MHHMCCRANAYSESPLRPRFLQGDIACVTMHVNATSTLIHPLSPGWCNSDNIIAANDVEALFEPNVLFRPGQMAFLLLYYLY